ncbi:hypothetical protein [Pararhodobacter sp. CCB-MM2]|uniref:hypothetical protein n=1 Tax=Pararhodobacter sp. CCB-MM2 TaxID=1786003 RepID=UPI00082A2ECE|nr:hypothetical protein [Pararhodobacter sp. CCB-MM2]
MIFPPDEIFTAAEAAAELNRSAKQVRRYLATGILGGNRRSGHWTTTALDIWRFKNIADEMLENWRRYCLELEERGAPKQFFENNGINAPGK